MIDLTSFIKVFIYILGGLASILFIGLIFISILRPLVLTIKIFFAKKKPNFKCILDNNDKPTLAVNYIPEVNTIVYHNINGELKQCLYCTNRELQK